MLSYLSQLLKCWHEGSVPRVRADRSELIFSAQPNTLKRWQRAYYKTFSWFLLGLWANGRRSFPRTQLAFSIWVSGPLLTPYSQNTHSSHRNSVEFAVHPGSTAHGISICPTAPDICSYNGYHRPRQAYLPGCLPVKRVSQASTSLFAQPPRCSARETGITGLDKPICPTAQMFCS